MGRRMLRPRSRRACAGRRCGTRGARRLRSKTTLRPRSRHIDVDLLHARSERSKTPLRQSSRRFGVAKSHGARPRRVSRTPPTRAAAVAWPKVRCRHCLGGSGMGRCTSLLVVCRRRGQCCVGRRPLRPHRLTGACLASIRSPSFTRRRRTTRRRRALARCVHPRVPPAEAQSAA